jgi:hypothetical protein
VTAVEGVLLSSTRGATAAAAAAGSDPYDFPSSQISQADKGGSANHKEALTGAAVKAQQTAQTPPAAAATAAAAGRVGSWRCRTGCWQQYLPQPQLLMLLLAAVPADTTSAAASAVRSSSCGLTRKQPPALPSWLGSFVCKEHAGQPAAAAAAARRCQEQQSVALLAGVTCSQVAAAAAAAAAAAIVWGSGGLLGCESGQQ